MIISTPYKLADGTAGVLRGHVNGEAVHHVELYVNGAIRGINATDFAGATEWMREEIAVRRVAPTLAGPAQVQFLECAVGVYGAAGMLAAASTAGDDEGAAVALRTRARRSARQQAQRASRMLDGPITADEREMLAAVVAKENGR